MLSPWHTYFATQATVAATLTGLLFVALSINLKHILSFAGLADRAAEALLLLLLPTLIGLAGTLPQSSSRAFGVEVLVLSVGAWSVVTRLLVVGRIPARDRPRREYAVRTALAEGALVPMLVAGALLVAEHPSGLWWQAVGAGLCLVAGVVDAWVLLVEILR
jgi:hypothetical protein